MASEEPIEGPNCIDRIVHAGHQPYLVAIVNYLGFSFPQRNVQREYCHTDRADGRTWASLSQNLFPIADSQNASADMEKWESLERRQTHESQAVVTRDLPPESSLILM